MAVVAVAGACSSSSPKSSKTSGSTTTVTEPKGSKTSNSTTTTLNIPSKFHFTGAGSAPFCTEDASLGDIVSGSVTGASDVKQQLDAVLSGLTKLEAVAPPDIKPDVTTVHSVFNQIYGVYQANGFDPNNAAVKSAVTNLSSRVQASGTRITAYITQYCKDTTTTTGAATSSTSAP